MIQPYLRSAFIKKKAMDYKYEKRNISILLQQGGSITKLKLQNSRNMVHHDLNVPPCCALEYLKHFLLFTYIFLCGEKVI